MPHLPASAAGLTPDELRQKAPRWRGETVGQQDSLFEKALEALKASVTHPAGDLDINLVAQSKRLPPKVLRQIFTELPASLVDAPGSEALILSLQELADKYPRVMSHFRVAPMHKGPDLLTDAVGGYSPGRPNAAALGLPPGIRPDEAIGTLEFNPKRLASGTATHPANVRALVRHEVAHGLQHLSDPTRLMSAYQRADQRVGYKGNPAERLARLMEKKPPVKLDRPPTSLSLDKIKRDRANLEWRRWRDQFPRHGGVPVEARRGKPSVYRNEIIRQMKEGE